MPLFCLRLHNRTPGSWLGALRIALSHSTAQHHEAPIFPAETKRQNASTSFPLSYPTCAGQSSAMSFGWSAGDIAQAITLIVKVVKALDSADGAASDYREATTFLQGLKHTLEPLQTFVALGAYPAYKDEIRIHVESIREPVESFLASVAKFDQSLGPNAKSGHHRHISSKLQWRFVQSKAVEKLRSKIDKHLKVLETLLQRLTL